MEFVPSVSRSSLTEDGGDALKGHKLQEDYREFIQEKMDYYWGQFPLSSHLSAGVTPEQRIMQSNILILFRKLREGILASRRVDEFALEVYETSLHLSVLYRAPAQTTSILGQLLPQMSGVRGFYDAFSRGVANPLDTESVYPTKLSVETGVSGDLQDREPEVRKSNVRQIYRPPHARHRQPSRGNQQGDPPAAGDTHVSDARPTPSRSRPPNALAPKYLTTWLLSLLHMLLQSYPSRSSYYRQLHTYQHYSKNTDAIRWLQPILASLETRNYVRLERVTRSSELDTMCRSLVGSDKISLDISEDAGCAALRCLIADLCVKARETAWEVLRAGYREVDVSQSADWLSRVLIIRSSPKSVGSAEDSVTMIQDWLAGRSRTEVSRKEGTPFEGRWTLYRQK